MFTRLSVLAACSAALLTSACASAPKYPILGNWLVTSYTSPGLSVPPLSLLTIVGSSATIEDDDLRFGVTRCDHPTYAAKPLTPAEFVEQYRTQPAELGLSGDRIETYELTCGEEWPGPPRVFIVRSDQALLVPWDGVFYELNKRPRP